MVWSKNNTRSLPVLGIDFDDVLFDCNALLGLILKNEFGFKGTYAEFILLRPRMEKMVFQFLYGSYHCRGQVVGGAKEAVAKLFNRYRMIVISGRSGTTQHVTKAWLEYNFRAKLDEVYFANTFLSSPEQKMIRKADICRSLGVTGMIEDSLGTASEIASAGIHVFLLDKPWNKGESTGVVRLATWAHVLKHLQTGERNE